MAQIYQACLTHVALELKHFAVVSRNITFVRLHSCVVHRGNCNAINEIIHCENTLIDLECKSNNAVHDAWRAVFTFVILISLLLLPVSTMPAQSSYIIITHSHSNKQCMHFVNTINNTHFLNYSKNKLYEESCLYSSTLVYFFFLSFPLAGFPFPPFFVSCSSSSAAKAFCLASAAFSSKNCSVELRTSTLSL